MDREDDMKKWFPASNVAVTALLLVAACGGGQAAEDAVPQEDGRLETLALDGRLPPPDSAAEGPGDVAAAEVGDEAVGRDEPACPDLAGDEAASCPSGTPCDDGDPCTEDDQCQEGGACSGVLLTCDDANPCTMDECDPLDGCVNTETVASCDDGDPCTIGDLCVGGACQAGLEPLLCDDSNPCTVDSCVEEVGCSFENAGPEVLCDDGNICTEGDHCESGACKPGVNGCGCLSDAQCEAVDDDNLCNGVLYCDETLNPPACAIDIATIVECKDLPPSACEGWKCEPATGKCKPAPANEGKGCNDGLFCTVEDKCTAGKCKGTAVPACGMGTPCEDFDDCLPGLTCFYGMPGGFCTDLNCPGVPCPDGSICIPVNNGTLHLCAPLCDEDADCRVEDGHGCTDDGGCWCGDEWCQGGEPACLGETAGMCNTCGSALEPGAVDCSALGQFCYLGQCVDCKPDCDGKACGSDGCEGSCGDCAGLQDLCVEGQCVCQPACKDKECGPDGCGSDCGACPEKQTCKAGKCTP
jgi:hypothetical protein